MQAHSRVGATSCVLRQAQHEEIIISIHADAIKNLLILSLSCFDKLSMRENLLRSALVQFTAHLILSLSKDVRCQCKA